ncbi:hypothetical protein FGO68_gene5185 [Halteria grandinella]|uniref:U6 snRNA-associated Sm-like protein LSm5 n=1 Tax=Halteria grandinella TaxID=5974 RepID=A0A8J8NIK8_HALGN|nr:hypothetical protein FGO68_gene5185 [Halteria grandinella]
MAASAISQTIGVGHVLPLEVVDKCIGNKVWIMMQGTSEFYGTLRGFDDYLNIVLDEVREYQDSGNGGKRMLVNTLDSMLLNGSHVCMIIPGDAPPPKGENEK